MLDPNGVVTNWNAGAQHIKGYGADEIVGQHFSRFYTDADRAAGGPMRALTIALKEGRYEAEGRPDLMFSDIVMAGDMDGIALARRVREIAPGVPVLLATGYSEAAERIGEEFPILRKPYQMAELSRAVGATLANARNAERKLIDLAAARKARA
jgi:DNA-binding LytR/AlgR family response regulator